MGRQGTAEHAAGDCHGADRRVGRPAPEIVGRAAGKDGEHIFLGEFRIVMAGAACLRKLREIYTAVFILDRVYFMGTMAVPALGCFTDSFCQRYAMYAFPVLSRNGIMAKVTIRQWPVFRRLLVIFQVIDHITMTIGT